MAGTYLVTFRIIFALAGSGTRIGWMTFNSAVPDAPRRYAEILCVLRGARNRVTVPRRSCSAPQATRSESWPTRFGRKPKPFRLGSAGHGATDRQATRVGTASTAHLTISPPFFHRT
jgi:hypothetical protein